LGKRAHAEKKQGRMNAGNVAGRRGTNFPDKRKRKEFTYYLENREKGDWKEKKSANLSASTKKDRKK